MSERELGMCKWGDTVRVRVKVPAYLSHTGRARWKDAGIDKCIAPLVQALQAAGINMTGSCCGHNKVPGCIALADGRELIVAQNYETARKVYNDWPTNIHGETLEDVQQYHKERNSE